MTGYEWLQIIAMFAGAASGSAAAVWWMFNREVFRLDRDISDAKKAATRAHARLDAHLENHH